MTMTLMTPPGVQKPVCNDFIVQGRSKCHLLWLVRLSCVQNTSRVRTRLNKIPTLAVCRQLLSANSLIKFEMEIFKFLLFLNPSQFKSFKSQSIPIEIPSFSKSILRPDIIYSKPSFTYYLISQKYKEYVSRKKVHQKLK